MHSSQLWKRKQTSATEATIFVCGELGKTFLYVVLGKQHNNNNSVGEGSGRSDLQWSISQRPQHKELEPRKPKVSTALSTEPPGRSRAA